MLLLSLKVPEHSFLKLTAVSTVVLIFSKALIEYLRFLRFNFFPNNRELAEKLSFQDKEQAELWIVNLIRNAKLDAKIDSSCGKVTMGVQYPSM